MVSQGQQAGPASQMAQGASLPDPAPHLIPHLMPHPTESAVVEWLTESARAFRFAIGPKGLLLGSAPGCDVRLGFPNPPVLAFLRYDAGRLLVRVLAPQIPFLVDDQIADNESALLMGSSFSLAGQKARVLFVAPYAWTDPAPVATALADLDIQPENAPHQPVQPSPDIGLDQDSQAPLWAPIVDQLREEAQRFQARQQELASLSEALESQAQAIDRWHAHLSLEESRLQERLSHLEQKEKELDARVMALPEPAPLSSHYDHAAPQPEARTPLATFTPDGNLDFARLYFPEPAELAPVVEAEAAAIEPSPVEIAPTPAMPVANDYSESETDHEFEVSAAWPEDDSWDFLRGGTDSVPSLPAETSPPSEFEAEQHESPPRAEGTALPLIQESPVEPEPGPRAEPEAPAQPPPMAAMPFAAIVAEVVPPVVLEEAPTSLVAVPLPKPAEETPAPSLKMALPPVISQTSATQEWKAPRSFDDWFLWHLLQLDELQGEASSSANEPMAAAAWTGSSLARWHQRGWIRQETAEGLAQLAQAQQLPLDQWLEQKHPGWIDWASEIERFPERFIVGAYLILEGDPATDAFLEAVHTATGCRAVLLAKPTSAKPPLSPNPAGASATWEALVKLEHENITPLTAILDQDNRTWGIWEIPSGRRLHELTRVSPALGIWYRLFLQATLGLRALHQANLGHGAIGSACFVLQPGGLLSFHQLSRLQVAGSAAETSRTMQKDLHDLGSLGWQWLEKIFGERERTDWKKWLPATLWELLDRLDLSGGTFPKITTVEELAQELDRLGLQIRANPFTWASFLDRQFPGRQNHGNETRKISA